jgi:hypothetical protein
VEVSNFNDKHRYQFILRSVLSGHTCPSTSELEIKENLMMACMPDVSYLQDAMPVSITNSCLQLSGCLSISHS